MTRVTPRRKQKGTQGKGQYKYTPKTRETEKKHAKISTYNSQTTHSSLKYHCLLPRKNSTYSLASTDESLQRDTSGTLTLVPSPVSANAVSLNPTYQTSPFSLESLTITNISQSLLLVTPPMSSMPFPAFCALPHTLAKREVSNHMPVSRHVRITRHSIQQHQSVLGMSLQCGHPVSRIH